MAEETPSTDEQVQKTLPAEAPAPEKEVFEEEECEADYGRPRVF